MLETVNQTANCKMVIITNPNNPTGTVLAKDDLIKFIKKVPSEVLVVIDEAYIEFVPTLSCVDLIQEYDNVIVLRSFSKAYGLVRWRLPPPQQRLKTNILLTNIWRLTMSKNKPCMMAWIA